MNHVIKFKLTQEPEVYTTLKHQDILLPMILTGLDEKDDECHLLSENLKEWYETHNLYSKVTLFRNKRGEEQLYVFFKKDGYYFIISFKNKVMYIVSKDKQYLKGKHGQYLKDLFAKGALEVIESTCYQNPMSDDTDIQPNLKSFMEAWLNLSPYFDPVRKKEMEEEEMYRFFRPVTFVDFNKEISELVAVGVANVGSLHNEFTSTVSLFLKDVNDIAEYMEMNNVTDGALSNKETGHEAFPLFKKSLAYHLKTLDKLCKRHLRH